MPSNFSGYQLFSRLTPASNDQAAIYTQNKKVSPQTTWIDVTSHDGAALENNKSYDFRIVPEFLGLGVNAGKFAGYGQPLQTFTNIVPRRVWNVDNVNATTGSTAIQLKRDYASAAGFWDTVVALPAAAYNALAGYLSFSGIVVSSQDTNEPGQYWAANCAANYAVIVTASGGYVVPVSCTITRNLAHTQSSTVLGHELGHALGIGTMAMWSGGVIQPAGCPGVYVLSGTSFKNALIGYQEQVRLRQPSNSIVYTNIPLLSVWPQGQDGAVGKHWEHTTTACNRQPGVPGELMSYDRSSRARTNVSIGALLDMGYRLCQPNATFKAQFMATAERPAANAMSMQSVPVWVPNETPQEILAPQKTGEVGGCCVSANIIGTLYLDGTEPTNV